MIRAKKVGVEEIGWLGWQEPVGLAEMAQPLVADGVGLVAEGKVKGGDARAEVVRRYLRKYNSPLLPYAKMIVDLSDKYGFDYYWMVAIGQQESNMCKKIPEDSHNCWGYGIHSQGTLRFESYELALSSYAQYLKESYFDKGLNTAELIMKKYCPHSDGSWAFGVNQFIEELKNGGF